MRILILAALAASILAACGDAGSGLPPVAKCPPFSTATAAGICTLP